MNFFTQPGQMIQKPSQQIGGLIGSGVARLIRGKSEDSEPTATDENPFGESTGETEEAAPEDTPAADENPFGENSAAPEATDEPPADENPFGESTGETEEAAPEDAPAAETNPFE
jgi:hypothetical protein